MITSHMWRREVKTSLWVRLALVTLAASCTVTACYSNQEDGKRPDQPASVFSNLREPPYVPGKGLTADGRRVLDIFVIQNGLLKYRVDKGRYPRSLSAVFPKYAALDQSVPAHTDALSSWRAVS